ncbi:phycobilisome linker polypeptide [Oscillatoria sp. FACHB-1406]|uniref:phycobilisome linker polypeptide n=1 Tax=Oscillatoria sp. FACHB-1406 TaxID=2692846 RepID=UPI00168807EB|nr:phycobilisome linker polypeptide [Oscillatoria sp. FACHB-1406]MBD2576146.1 phycobilisome linker polypeptide [Oscillatoria sp. FACHB-1406]
MTSLAAAQRLGFEPFLESGRVELRPNYSPEDAEVVIRAVYRQVLGNDHLMAGERLTSAESLLRNGSISVKDFVRAVAQSEVYRNKFFHTLPQNRFIELNYKHLLGRAIYDQSEVAYHTDLYNQRGYAADIDSYIDSLEYQENFGDSIVPYYRGFETQRGQKTVGFSRMFQLYRGYATSDRAVQAGRLTREVAQNTASRVFIGSTQEALAGVSGGSRGKFYRVRAIQAPKPGRMAKIRRSNLEYLVPYEQLSSKLQEINARGGKVLGVSPA